MPTKQELDEIKQKLHGIVWPLLLDDQAVDWKLKGGKDKKTTGLIYKAEKKGLGVIWKLECELAISVDNFKKLFIDELKPTDWAPHVAEYKILEASDEEGWEITYTLSKGVPTVDDRDFVNVRFRDFLGDGSIYELTESIVHPAAPKRPKIIRGLYMPSGCLIRPDPVDPNKIAIVWINNVDMKVNCRFLFIPLICFFFSFFSSFNFFFLSGITSKKGDPNGNNRLFDRFYQSCHQ